MKKIVLSLLFTLAAVGCFSQATTLRVSSGFVAPNWVYVGGTTSDTLYASDTLQWSIRIAAQETQYLSMRLLITKVTGTVSDTVYFYGSFDGTTLDAAIDTITNSNVSTGYKYVTASRWTAFNYPYIIIRNWDKGGARNGVKSVRRLDIMSRNN